MNEARKRLSTIVGGAGGAEMQARQKRARADVKKLALMQSAPESSQSNNNNQVYDLTTIGFVTLDKQGRIRKLNQKTARLLGFPANWLLNRPFIVYVATHDVGRFLNLLIEAARTGARQTAEFDLAVDRDTIPVRISMVGIGNAGKCLLEILDLTDLRQTESQLRESLSQWYSLVTNAPDTIMTVERTGKIIFVNMPVWGCSTGALLGTVLYDYVPPRSRSKLRRCLDAAFKVGVRSI
jgi:PAS domain S-box-containing protein